MNKLMCLLAVVCMVFLSGCGGKKEPAPQPQLQNVTEKKEVEKPFLDEEKFKKWFLVARAQEKAQEKAREKAEHDARLKILAEEAEKVRKEKEALEVWAKRIEALEKGQQDILKALEKLAPPTKKEPEKESPKPKKSAHVPSTSKPYSPIGPLEILNNDFQAKLGLRVGNMKTRLQKERDSLSSLLKRQYTYAKTTEIKISRSITVSPQLPKDDLPPGRTYANYNTVAVYSRPEPVSHSYTIPPGTVISSATEYILSKKPEDLAAMKKAMDDFDQRAKERMGAYESRVEAAKKEFAVAYEAAKSSGSSGWQSLNSEWVRLLKDLNSER